MDRIFEQGRNAAREDPAMQRAALSIQMMADRIIDRWAAGQDRLCDPKPVSA